MHGKGGTPQIELVSGPRREEIRSIADERRKFADLIIAGHIFEPLPVVQQIVEKVGVEAAPGVDRDLPGKNSRVVTGAFQSLPGDFEKDFCCGSVSSASRGRKLKKPASNSSTPSKIDLART